LFNFSNQRLKRYIESKKKREREKRREEKNVVVVFLKDAEKDKY